MRQEKQFLLDEIDDQLKQSESFVLLGYNSFNANAANDFRAEVSKMGGNVQMVRKRILVKAAKQRGLEVSLEDLPGHIGLVFGGTDILETTKYLFKYGKENNEQVTVLGGQFEGAMHNADTMKQLAALPSKDEMRAQLLSVLEAPLSQTLATMDALITSVIYCLDNKSQHN
jgi:large subunit ribosomal protein L10